MGKAPASSWAPQARINVPEPVQKKRCRAVVVVLVVVGTTSLYQSLANSVIEPLVPVNVPSLLVEVRVPVLRLKTHRPRFAVAPSSTVRLSPVTVPLAKKDAV